MWGCWGEAKAASRGSLRGSGSPTDRPPPRARTPMPGGRRARPSHRRGRRAAGGPPGPPPPLPRRGPARSRAEPPEREGAPAWPATWPERWAQRERLWDEFATQVGEFVEAQKVRSARGLGRAGRGPRPDRKDRLVLSPVRELGAPFLPRLARRGPGRRLEDRVGRAELPRRSGGCRRRAAGGAQGGQRRDRGGGGGGGGAAAGRGRRGGVDRGGRGGGGAGGGRLCDGVRGPSAGGWDERCCGRGGSGGGGRRPADGRGAGRDLSREVRQVPRHGHQARDDQQVGDAALGRAQHLR